MKLYLGILIIFMILITGCMSTTSNTQKIVMAQVTVEPPAPISKSGLDMVVIPNPTQIQINKNFSPSPSSTLVYGIYESNGGYITIKNSSGVSSIVTVVTTIIPEITPVTTITTTPTPTPTTIPTQTIVPTIIPTQTTIIPTTTRSPTPTPTPLRTLTPTPTLTLFPTPILGETFGAEASNPTGSPIGGGSGYNKMVLKSNAKYIVSTKQELLDAFKVAKPGEIVFVNGNATIDMTGTNSNIIPAGIIFASDRGQGGSQGGMIKRYRTSGIQWSQTPCFVINDNNVRITGLRFDGGEDIRDQLTDQLSSPIQPLNMIAAREVFGLEIDNNEFYGFSYAAIELDNSNYWNHRNSGGDAWVHHNNISYCQARGYGYGICLVGGHVLCEANIFDYMRHAICAEGFPGESYEFRYNHHLGHGYPIGASVCDVHAYPPGDYEDENSIAGYQYKIHHNTFDRPERPDMSDNYAIGIRARTTNGVYIDHNIFNYNSASGLPVFLRACNINNVMFMSRNLIGYDGETPTLVTGEAIMYNVTMPNHC